MKQFLGILTYFENRVENSGSIVIHINKNSESIATVQMYHILHY